MYIGSVGRKVDAIAGAARRGSVLWVPHSGILVGSILLRVELRENTNSYNRNQAVVRNNTG